MARKGERDLKRERFWRAVLRRQPRSGLTVSGHLFVFINRRRDRVKLLSWCGDGFAIWYRRLEKGTFQLPSARKDEVRLEMKTSDLSLILDGIDLTSVRRRPRYERPALVQS